MANAAAVKALKELAWDKIQYGDSELKAAVVTVQNIPFMFADNLSLCVMCDEKDGFYTSKEIIGTIKKYGNYADFDDSRVISPLVDESDLENLDIDTITAAIKECANTNKFTAKAKTQCANTDWNAVAEELTPYIKALLAMSNPVALSGV